jgi:hypothetical protein
MSGLDAITIILELDNNKLNQLRITIITYTAEFIFKLANQKSLAYRVEIIKDNQLNSLRSVNMTAMTIISDDDMVC